MGCREMLVHDVADLRGTTPAQRDTGASVSIIVDDEFVRYPLGVEPIGAVAIGSDPGDARPWGIGIERKVGCRQVGRWQHGSAPEINTRSRSGPKRKCSSRRKLAGHIGRGQS